uniref:Uncharacterized protein n=1 Tax=Anguilla anguilla TaxID=7936 RepID=A0A0E9U0F6_ANGAN
MCKKTEKYSDHLHTQMRK